LLLHNAVNGVVNGSAVTLFFVFMFGFVCCKNIVFCLNLSLQQNKWRQGAVIEGLRSNADSREAFTDVVCMVDAHWCCGLNRSIQFCKGIPVCLLI